MSHHHGPSSGGGRDLSRPWRSGPPASAGPTTSNVTASNSANYRGDLTNPRNQSANIPEDENCATWWTNLPPDCTYEMLFDSMRNVGAISHAVINPPVGIHNTSAAKVEFFDRASVDRLLNQANNGHLRGHIRVGGRIPHIALNRVRVASHSNTVPRDHGNRGRGSRVLQVIGNPINVNQQVLQAVLNHPQHRVIYGLERIATNILPDGLHCVEFRFASYTVQASRARDVFMSQKQKRELSNYDRALWEEVVCLFAADPCE
ncbi:hypothetical protein F4808DRAFT_470158 [Astrocystis sublimbata]|nr:hypothetical protein F4808DRAFT_470158 [Astrocystis sublimbata]